MRDQLNRWLDDEIHRPGLPFDSADVAALLDAVEHYRVRAVALESEVAALTDALGNPDVTHEFVDNGELYAVDHRVCGTYLRGQACDLPEDHPIHRTPARVRAELEGQ